jgi:hypothetical protein
LPQFVSGMRLPILVPALLSFLALPAGEALTFKRVMDTPFPKHTGTASGDLAIGDLDGDGRKDLLVVGAMNGKATCLLYAQKSIGVFTPVSDIGLPALDGGGMVRLADLDGDKDLDALLCGRIGTGNQTAILKAFRNDGKGHFEPMADLGVQLPLEDFEDVAGAWGKAATHPDNLTDAEVKGLYNFNGWSRGSLEIADLNGDGKMDVVFAGTKGMESGTDSAGQQIQRDWETSGVFIGDGTGGFAYLTATGWPQAGLPKDPEHEPSRSYPGLPKVQRAAMAVADFNGDGKMDVALFGQANMGPKANAGIPETQRNGKPWAEVLLGKGDGTFTTVTDSGLIPMIDGAMVTVDFNKDGKMDLAVMGSTGHPKDPDGGRCVRILLGKGDGSFAPDPQQIWQRAPNTTAGLSPMMSGDLAFGDLDGDGDLDLVMCGNTTNRETYVYRNDDGKLTLLGLDKMKQGLGSTDVRGIGSSDATTECDLRIEDLDGDGDADLVINGRGGSTQLLVLLNKLK